jgi:5-(carboxyamino)imidazole ribonucleotide mutase
MILVIIAGSEKDKDHVEQIANPFRESFPVSIHYCSAHKSPRELLEILGRFENEDQVVFVTVAGRSNALSGMVAANTPHIVIACPVFASVADYQVDIHSTLRMPSNVPVLTVLAPGNCVLAVKRIFASWSN